jgi:hypothetical protein
MDGADDDKCEHDNNSKGDHHGATPISPARTKSNLLRDFRHAQIFPESSTIWALESPDIEQLSTLTSHIFDYRSELAGAVVFRKRSFNQQTSFLRNMERLRRGSRDQNELTRAQVS